MVRLADLNEYLEGVIPRHARLPNGKPDGRPGRPRKVQSQVSVSA
jgi:hypothetical protein